MVKKFVILFVRLIMVFTLALTQEFSVTEQITTIVLKTVKSTVVFPYSARFS